MFVGGACYGAAMTQEEKKLLKGLRRTVRRRRLFASVFTEEVLEQMAHLFGVQRRLFSFAQGADGAYDPLQAMRVDTLRGVIDTLRYEASPDSVKRAAAALEQAEKEYGMQADKEVADHA